MEFEAPGRPLRLRQVLPNFVHQRLQAQNPTSGNGRLSLEKQDTLDWRRLCLTLRNSVRMTEPQTQQVFTGSWTVKILLFDTNCPGTSFFKHWKAFCFQARPQAHWFCRCFFGDNGILCDGAQQAVNVEPLSVWQGLMCSGIIEGQVAARCLTQPCSCERHTFHMCTMRSSVMAFTSPTVSCS
jgi:hypothetical protein